MLKMNLWDAKWDLDEAQCPCDIHFNQWVETEKLTAKAIYHFGTGTHHVVGRRQAELGNDVLAITASKEEYESYIELVSQHANVARRYLAYFGDIYLTNARLLPDFDVVTLFHLCEFFHESTASPQYGGITDAKLLDLLTAKVRPGGCLLFYKGSFAFGAAEPIIAKWEKAGVERLPDFKTLQIYRKK